MNLRSYLEEALKDLFIRPKANLKSLDGLRALAIFFVVCMHVKEHFQGTATYGSSFLADWPPFKGGWIGVPLFFVLSGFLIGGQLWKEFFKENDIQFTRFIIRRGLRIWPLYYFVMAVVYIFSITYSYTLKSLFTNIFFLGNYLYDTGPIFGSWSLATEEQFYILAPLFLLLMNRLFPGKNEKFYRRILIGMFFLPLIFRFITWHWALGMKQFDLFTYMQTIYRPFHNNCEGLIIGMIIANFYYDKDSKLFSRDQRLAVYYWGSLVIFLLSFASKITFNFTGIAIGFGALLIYCLRNEGLFVKILSLDLFYFLSKISFAAYLIHVHVIKNLMPVTFIKQIAIQSGTLELLIATFIAFFMTALLSIVLYIFVEKPFLMLRNQLLHKPERIGSENSVSCFPQNIK